jgi:hypothetical protein
VIYHGSSQARSQAVILTATAAAVAAAAATAAMARFPHHVLLAVLSNVCRRCEPMQPIQKSATV